MPPSRREGSASALDPSEAFNRWTSVMVLVRHKRAWSFVRDSGYVIGVLGFFLTAAMWVADRSAPRGSWIFSLETVGLILLLVGFALATAGGIAFGSMWPYGPIK